MDSVSSKLVQWRISGSDSGIERQRNLESRLREAAAQLRTWLTIQPGVAVEVSSYGVQLAKGWLAIDYRQSNRQYRRRDR